MTCAQIALADGSLPADDIKGRLGAEKARKTTLQTELTKLEQMAGVAGLDTAHLKRTLREKISDVTALLRQPCRAGAPDAPEAPHRQDRAGARGSRA